MHPAPTSCRTTSTIAGEALQNWQDRFKNPLQGAYLQEKHRKKCLRAKFELLSGRQNALVPRALIPLKPAKQGDEKSVQQGEIRALPSLSSHTELPSAPSRKELTHLYRLAPHMKQLIHQKLYIIGNNLEQTTTCGTGTEGHTHHLPSRLNSASQERTWNYTLLIAPEAPSRRQVEVVHAVLSNCR